jgi:hypothetical protein
MTERTQPKGEYEQSMTIHASADDIFDLVADVRNMPMYLPTTKRAEPQPGDRVLVQGEAEGHPYSADGFLRADRDRHTLEWGADEHNYAGRLEIQPQGQDASTVTVHLSFRQYPGEGHGPSDEDIQEGLVKALQSIENLVTGRGGKVEPNAAT